MTAADLIAFGILSLLMILIRAQDWRTIAAQQQQIRNLEEMLSARNQPQVEQIPMRNGVPLDSY